MEDWPCVCVCVCVCVLCQRVSVCVCGGGGRVLLLSERSCADCGARRAGEGSQAGHGGRDATHSRGRGGTQTRGGACARAETEGAGGRASVTRSDAVAQMAKAEAHKARMEDARREAQRMMETREVCGRARQRAGAWTGGGGGARAGLVLGPHVLCAARELRACV